MQYMGLNELRERYLKFFEGKEHLRLPSFPLVPINDPGLLLINSGMAPLKPYFTGVEEPPRKRITTCQKCIRTPDIENVGKTSRHGTFFEMLGNFSFGDYFKNEIIPWAWEFITEDIKLPVDKLYVSIYLEDDEAFEIWNKKVGIPAERIVRLGKADNFWEIGTGPCGPCSEIYFDRGEDKGCGKPDCKVGCDCDRFVEFWNLVFTQFNRDDEGNYTRLQFPNIDTGMGLERLACVVQGVNNLFEVDTIKNILLYICSLTGVKYGESYKKDVSIRVITDHIRGTTHMISDGVIPSNEGRGYVLRRLIRRAARHGKLLGLDKPFLFDVARIVIRESKEAYPHLTEKEEYIIKVIRSEEERFGETLGQGLEILNKFIDDLKEKDAAVLSGDNAFKLYDTYGFPLDLTRDVLEEQGLTVDEEGFTKEMEKQREKARAAIKDADKAGWGDDVYSKLGKGLKTSFKGYTDLESESSVAAIIRDDEIVNEAAQGEEVGVLMDSTSFYGESGGQVGDTGTIAFSDGFMLVRECKKLQDGKIIHIGIIEKGNLKVGTEVTSKADGKRRAAIARNHSATHLLQKALRNVLGSHVAQSGSLVEPERLRFDFTHFTPVSPEELTRVENEVNKMILENLIVEAKEMPIDEARKMGAMALFGEKYGDIVRLVKMEDYSLELCGGCHVKSTAQVGTFKIVSESGVAAGVRRIEAVTGEGALEYFRQKETLLGNIAEVLKTNPNDALRRTEQLLHDLKAAEKEIEQLRRKLVSGSIDNVVNNAKDFGGIKVISARFDHMDMEGLRETGDMLKNKIGSGVIILASGYEGKVNFVVMATKDAVQKGIHAGNIVREAAKLAGGGGGGRPDMAQAGGKDTAKIDESLNKAVQMAEEALK